MHCFKVGLINAFFHHLRVLFNLEPEDAVRRFRIVQLVTLVQFRLSCVMTHIAYCKLGLVIDVGELGYNVVSTRLVKVLQLLQQFIFCGQLCSVVPLA